MLNFIRRIIDWMARRLDMEDDSEMAFWEIPHHANARCISNNEWRQANGLPPITWDDVPKIPLPRGVVLQRITSDEYDRLLVEWNEKYGDLPSVKLKGLGDTPADKSV